MPHKIAKSRTDGSYVPLDHPDAVVEEISGQKRRVVMSAPNHALPHEAVDYVPVEHLAQYVAEARTRWESVTVPEPDTHDAGPGGDDQHLVEN